MRLAERLSHFQSSLFSFDAIGFDLSDESFHFVKARSAFPENPEIEYFGRGSIPAGLIQFGEIRNEAELSKILSGVLLKNKMMGSHPFAVASLPEEKAFLKLLKIPRTETEAELKNAIRFEAETNIPLSADDMYFDYEDITPAGILDHRDVVVIAYPRAIVDSYVRVFRAAGFQLLALELESQGILRSLIDAKGEKDAVLVVDIGRTRSGFVMFHDRSIVSTSTIPIGGRDFEKAIEDALAIEQHEAEKIKKEIGYSNDPRGQIVRNALKPLVTVILDEAKKRFDFFESHPRHSHAELAGKKIVLCGGDSLLERLSAELADAVGVVVEYGNPLLRFQPAVKGSVSLSSRESLGYATALGLSLRTVSEI